MGTSAAIVWTWRLRLGLGLFALSLGWPLAIPVLVLLDVDGGFIAAFSAAMLGVAELLLIVAVAIAGKEGFAAIKGLVFGLLRTYGPPQTIGRTRHTLGLVLFVIPLLYAWAAPYASRFLPALEQHELEIALVLDGVLVASLFVLGGDFWDKLRALFVHGARAVFPV